MKSGRTLQELAIELDRQAASKRDFIVGGAAIEMDDNGNVIRLNNGTGNQPIFGTSNLFHRQLGTALNIPSKYYDRMRSDYPDLLARNVNGWLGRDDTRHTVRTLDGSARAFLSDRYRRIDNYDIAKVALPVIGEMAGANVESCEITETRMYIKVVNTRLTAEVRKGDIVQAGIVISNSEVGLGSVSVMPLVFRLVCLNGMIINDLGTRKYHIGRENEETWELFSNETIQADDAAFMLKLADIVRTAVDETRFSMAIDKLRGATEAKITGRVPEVVELTAKQYGFNKNEESDIHQHLIAGGDLTLYGLSNAVTRTATDAPDYDRATALESTGWNIATMPKDTWHLINAEAMP